MPEKFVPKKLDNRYTIKSLRLNIGAAENGKTWLLLPDGYRDKDSGETYPLPGRREELQKVASIYVPHWQNKRDGGCRYIRRAMEEWKKRQQRMTSAVNDAGLRTQQIKRSQHNYNYLIKQCKEDARQAVDDVRQEAAKAVASLTDLFSLGRQGIDAQMRAYLAHEELNGEQINARAFRECFRIVTQAVKGLGLPSDQRKPASNAVMEELAAALKATQEAVGMAPTVDFSDAAGDEKLN